MNRNKRIFLNVLAICRRLLYTLVLGLPQSLEKAGCSLGELTAVVTFPNYILSFAVGCFYAHRNLLTPYKMT